MKKSVIACDLDDVLFDFAKPLINYSNQVLGQNIKYKDVFSYNLDEVFDCSYDKSVKIVQDFCATDTFLNLPLFPDSKNALNYLSEKYEIIFITARHGLAEELTKLQIEKNLTGLNGYSQNIFFTRQYQNKEPKIPKSEVCKNENARLIIEDNFENSQDCSSKGIPAIIFRRPWNEKYLKQKHKDIYPVKTWKQALELVEKIINF